MSPAQAGFLSWVSAVLVDIVVLNLFVEFVHTIVIDSFSISILTAVLLKLMVDAVKGLEHSVSAYFTAKEGAVWKPVRFLAVWLVLFLSKFVILEAVNVVFGDHVELGSFIEIVGIIVTMLAANAALLAVYRSLGARDTEGRLATPPTPR
jgi:hypothetical protein